ELLPGETELTPGGGAVEGRRRREPRVGEGHDAIARYAVADELVGQGARDGDDRVEAHEGAALEPLVEPVAEPAAGEAVNGRDDRDTERAGDAGVNEIGPIAVGVDDVGSEAPAEVGQAPSLGGVA